MLYKAMYPVICVILVKQAELINLIENTLYICVISCGALPITSLWRPMVYSTFHGDPDINVSVDRVMEVI